MKNSSITVIIAAGILFVAGMVVQGSEKTNGMMQEKSEEMV